MSVRDERVGTIAVRVDEERRTSVLNGRGACGLIRA